MKDILIEQLKTNIKHSKENMSELENKFQFTSNKCGLKDIQIRRLKQSVYDLRYKYKRRNEKNIRESKKKGKIF